MSGYIYVDNAATTRLDMDAFEAMKPYMLEEYGNASQPYFFSKKPKHALKQARITIAECIGASPNEIFFTSGGTESDNWAIKKFTPFNTDIRHIVTSNIEHHAVLHSVESEKINSKANVAYNLKDRVLFFLWKFLNDHNLNTVHKDILVEGVGSNIKSVNRIIKELANENIVEYNKGFIKVNDINNLVDIIFSPNPNNNLVGIFNKKTGGNYDR